MKVIPDRIGKRFQHSPHILQFDVGHFCGILVEGSNKEFNTRFKNISCEPRTMPERNFLFDVESNFRTIHAQIKELVH